MTQRHWEQHGTVHITTNARRRVPWCTEPGIPQILIDNLMMTRNLQGAEVYAFCILPDHMHLILRPGKKGLSEFMRSFKTNASRDAHKIFQSRYNLRCENHLRSWGPRTPATRKMHDNGTSERTRATCEGIIHSRSRGSVTPAIPRFTGWQNGFHDERIQSAEQRTTALHYVEYNAWRHGLIDDPEVWPWSSLCHNALLDPTAPW